MASNIPPGGMTDGWMAEFRRDIETIKVELTAIRSTMVGRAEIEAMDSRRVSLEAFSGEALGIKERLTRLETNPQRQLGWIALATTVGIGCFTGIVALAGAIIALIALFH